MRHIDWGLGYFQARAFDDVPDDRPTDLADVYARLLARGELAGFEVHERFYEIGSDPTIGPELPSARSPSMAHGTCRSNGSLAISAPRRAASIGTSRTARR